MTNQTPESVIAEALIGAGLSDRPDEFDSNIHSWRCEYPERYGRCKCFEETVAGAAAALRAANMLREPGVLAAHDAEAAARQIDAPSVREAIGEVLADMDATAEGTHVASSLALLQEITDAAIRAAVSPPSRTAKRTGYETVGHGVGEHSQKITARAAEYRKAVQ